MRHAVGLACWLAIAAVPAWADDGRKLNRALRQPIDSVAMAEAMPLAEVLASYSLRYQINIVIDSAGFEESLELEQVERQPVQLPKLFGVSLHTTLRLAVAQVGGVIVQQADQVWVVPADRRLPLMLGQRVDVRYREERLSQAIQDLCERSGGVAELDVRQRRALRRRVTLDQKGVFFDEAVAELARQAGLEAVLFEEVLFVTTPEVARSLRMQMDSQR